MPTVSRKTCIFLIPFGQPSGTTKRDRRKSPFNIKFERPILSFELPHNKSLLTSTSPRVILVRELDLPFRTANHFSALTQVRKPCPFNHLHTLIFTPSANH